MEVYTEVQSAQSSTTQQNDTPLTPEHRRLLLGASIRVLGRRFSCGKPISQNDVLRVASLADDVERAA